mmetsp:Transcript_36495/g.91478  ORF Transcript_36495/g.91478 Transcript_36495/m.91478 type:complete len:177 (-) Transcript_36495:82-612(-)|eukprot:CAMPEP_0177639106 /NCGR_PEP_ID=MMETSP0447-20121125/5846_1 /TAXON_ID=0 /ORGANISM="Stygamoeba regulata, Strain BSH-02190019" /LENGTH=176 /DNA_ID=CAMNT_0019141115 /DNA_START=58 /DNA_END=588 /DNA_ORIENTATION=+
MLGRFFRVSSATLRPGTTLSWGRCKTPDSLAGESAQNQRTEIILHDEELEESFVKGSGRGGQKINKTSNCVFLKHIPTGLFVKCQDGRSLENNRGIARKLLKEKLDVHINGGLSKQAEKIAKIQKKKRKMRQRSLKKHGKMSNLADFMEESNENKAVELTDAGRSPENGMPPKVEG